MTPATQADLLPLARLVVDGLGRAGLTLALAESCTGGMAACLVTSVPGASHVFPLGVVAYSDRMKQDLLAVEGDTLRRFGAASEETAAAMAAGVRHRAGTAIGAAVSGIAGPGGGTPDKPVGTVCFGFATLSGVLAERRMFTGDRQDVRMAAAAHVLEMIRRHCERKIGQG